MAKIGINGFGRIGRMVTRLATKKELEIMAINDPNIPLPYMAHLLQQDTSHGKFQGSVSVSDDRLMVNDKAIKVFKESDPKNIPWGDACVDYVVESTGSITTMEKACELLKDSVKKVILTAPSNDVPMFICGVNLDKYTSDMQVVSNASCTTNCVVPLVNIINSNFCIDGALMSTIHSLNESNSPLDSVSTKSWRDGRGFMNNIIPTSTNAVEAVVKIIPELEGKFNGMAFVVPVTNVSLLDLTVLLKNPADLEKLKELVMESSKGPLKDILGVAESHTVSSDFISDTRSAIIDFDSSMFLNPNFGKLVAWFDNEAAYSARVVDLIQHIQKVDEESKKNGNGAKNGDASKPKCNGAKNGDPCKKKDANGAKNGDPCKKKDANGAKNGDPCKKDANGAKNGDPCKKDANGAKNGDPCKKKDANGAKNGDPCKKDANGAKNGDPCKKKDANGAKNGDPCKKDANGAEKPDPCKKDANGAEKPDPCKKDATGAEKPDPCKKDANGAEKADPCKQFEAKKTEPKNGDPCKKDAKDGKNGEASKKNEANGAKKENGKKPKSSKWFK